MTFKLIQNNKIVSMKNKDQKEATNHLHMPQVYKMDNKSFNYNTAG